MNEDPRPGEDRREHWDVVHGARAPEEASWYQAAAEPSLELIENSGAGHEVPLIDVGGGTSPLAGALVAEGFTDVTVLDVSRRALDLAAGRPGADKITWLHDDLLEWTPSRVYGLWHDRAVFHFLTDPADRAVYLATLRTALALGGILVLGVFSPDGPAECSGLPVARYSADDLTALLGDAFTVIDSFTRVHRTPTGSPQPFTWLIAGHL